MAKPSPWWGTPALTLRELNDRLKQRPFKPKNSPWFKVCSEKRREWESFKQQRFIHPTLFDEVWGKDVLTQPAVIKAATDWARSNAVVSFFDAGDVQANGFQIVEDDRLGRTFTETGASYMGFSGSALLATGLASQPFYGLAFTGDGSLAMCPQILIDGAEHGAHGCILLLDNRRMGAITGLQLAQYGEEHATHTVVPVDFTAWGRSVQGVLALDGGEFDRFADICPGSGSSPFWTILDPRSRLLRAE